MSVQWTDCDCSASPDLHHAGISKQLGAQWRALSAQQRAPYQQEADRLRVLHMMEFPDYKYRPRKRARRKAGGKTEESPASPAPPCRPGPAHYPAQQPNSQDWPQLDTDKDLFPLSPDCQVVMRYLPV